MTQPVGSGSRSYDYESWQHAAEQPHTASDRAATSSTERAALDMCRHADTVTEGFLCDEPTVVSNACRSPKNDFDKTICDDKKMGALQEGLWEATKDAVKLIFQVLVGKTSP